MNIRIHSIAPNLQSALTSKHVLFLAVLITPIILFLILIFTIGDPCSCTPPEREAEIEVKNLSSMVEQYMLKGSPPKLPDTLEDLTQGRNPVTKKVPQDPWGSDYIYRKTGGRQFEIFSAGPDGQEGTEDDITADQ